MTGGLALLSYQRGEDNDEALIGAMLIWEHQSAMISWMRAWERAHKAPKRRR